MIGIITFQDTTNFGAMLQTFALQNILFRMGMESEIINYENAYVSRNEKPSKLFEAKTIRDILRYFLLHSAQELKYNKFQDFARRYIVFSNKIYDKDNIETSNEIYDIFLTGSDQIWNIELTDNDFNYLLKFVDNSKLKIAYASSFGGLDIPDNFKNEYKRCLSKFKKICVREKDGVEQIKNKLRLSANVVLDPTLLMTRNDWDKINCSERLMKENYILVYFIERTKENFNLIRNFAKAKRLKIIYLQNFIKSESGMVNDRTAGPLEFLNLIKYASVIYTGSFHGLCFSVIYNKNFYMTYSPARKRQSRIDNLLSLLEIDSRDIDKSKISEVSCINYERVNQNLDLYRNRSLDLLKESLS